MTASSGAERFIVTIRDSEADPDYDFHVSVPDGVSPAEAIDAVGAMIRAVKAADPDEFSFEDLQPRLVAAGYLILAAYTCPERW